jgi:hypothetical protein
MTLIARNPNPSSSKFRIDPMMPPSTDCFDARRARPLDGCEQSTHRVIHFRISQSRVAANHRKGAAVAIGNIIKILWLRYYFTQL